jgi:hypothetical protein
MIATRWRLAVSELFWGILAVLGCLGMVAFEALSMWLLVPKN